MNLPGKKTLTKAFCAVAAAATLSGCAVVVRPAPYAYHERVYVEPAPVVVVPAPVLIVHPRHWR